MVRAVHILIGLCALASASACSRGNETYTGEPPGPNAGVTGCRSNADCGTLKTCVITSTGATCQDPANPPQGSTVTPGSVTPSPTPCGKDSECSASGQCVAGYCAPSCSAGGPPCNDGQSCVAGRCVVNGAASCGTGGNATCQKDEQCGANRRCDSGRCRASCASGATCAIGEACSEGICKNAVAQKAQCTFDVDCGMQSRCVNAFCHPKCASNSECAGANVCDRGLCRGDTRPAG